MAADKPSATAKTEGDRAIYDRLVADQYEPIYRYFWWLCQSREVASDLTQESFASAWRSLGRFDGRAPAAWLHGIAARVWRQYLQHLPATQSARLDLAEKLADPLPLPDECAAAEMVRQRVDAAVRRLPEKYRQVVVLHYYQDLTQPEVAAALGIGIGLVKWRISQSLRRLERMLDPWAESEK